MSKFLDWNHHRGTWYEYDYDPQEDKAIVSIKQDIQPVVDYAAKLRNSGKNDKAKSFSHYAIIPAHVEVALKQRGINIHNPNQTKELIKVIETEYPHLKVTNLKHGFRN